jgi:uncharacterized protein with PIN domain
VSELRAPESILVRAATPRVAGRAGLDLSSARKVLADEGMIENDAVVDAESGGMRFEIDSMLVKLGRYLRCLGYDAEWDAERSLATRIERADAESRVFLTRNHNIGHQVPAPARMLLLASDDAVEQLWHVVRELRLDPYRHLFTRCIRCNVALAEIEKSPAVAARVPAQTFACYARFYTCPRCGTVFWKGSHVRNTCTKLGLRDASE